MPSVLLPLLVLACNSESPDAVQITSQPTRSTESEVPDPQAALEAQGWAPVFRVEGQLEALGTGLQLVGPQGIADAELSTKKGPCGGRILRSSDRFVLVLPPDTQGTPPPTAPAVQAAHVETATWRLDEVLPKSKSPEPTEGVDQPARQRQIALGSLSKTRRHGAPPVFIATGVRDCTAAVTILDSELTTVLDHHSWEGVCTPVAVMPASDLDGDGRRELTVFNDRFVGLLELIETPGSITLQPLGSWQCELVP